MNYRSLFMVSLTSLGFEGLEFRVAKLRLGYCSNPHPTLVWGLGFLCPERGFESFAETCRLLLCTTGT